MSKIQITTDGLLQKLMHASNLDSFLSDNSGHFCKRDVAKMLHCLFTRKNISKATLAKQAGMSEVYLHQIFAGKRNPSRNRLLCLCYGLGASLDETQELLKFCDMAQLYPRFRRDAIIMYGLIHHVNLFEINDKLFTEGEETLL